MKALNSRAIAVSSFVWGWLLAGAALGQCEPAAGREREGKGGQGSYAAARSDLEKRLSELRARFQAVDWPAVKAAEIGRRLRHDPASCRRFIRASLRHEPYRGVLRGGDGALASGGGNSADLCLLLRDMLQESEPCPRMRFAVAELPVEEARKLVEACLRAPPARAAFLGGSPGQSRAPDEASPASRKEVFGRHAMDTRRLLEDAEADSIFLRDHRGPAGGGSDDRAEATEAARQHVWLQVERGGLWESLDPAAGLPLPSAGVDFLDQLPREWQHAVRLRLEMERLEDGSLRREPILEKEWLAAALSGRAIEVVVAPEGLSAERLLSARSKENPILEHARSFRWFGALAGLAGEPLEASRRFDLDGRTSAPPPSGPLALGGVDPFGRTARGKPAPAKSELAGLWMVFTITGPGTEPRRIERALLDRIGPAGRAGGKLELAMDWRDRERAKLALIQRHQALISTGTVGLLRLARESLESVVNRPLIERALAIEHGAYQGKLHEAMEGLPELPADLIAISDAALSLTEAAVAGGGIAYLGEPNLYLRSETLAPGEPGEVLHRIGIDIAWNDLEVLGDQHQSAELRRRHGILVSEMEGRSLGPGPARSAARVLRAARERKIELRRIEKLEELEGIQAGTDSKAVMAAQLVEGAVLLVPTRPVELSGEAHTAWWRLDRKGRLLAIGADGRGQAVSEGLFVLKEISIPMVRRCTRFVACLNRAIAAGGSPQGAGAECLGETIRDIVKESLDKAIDHFIKDPLNEKLDEARAAMLGEDYEKLYQNARKALEGYQKVTGVLKDPAGAVPGVGEGRNAASAGAEIGSLYGAKIYLLLVMGREIAEHAYRQ